MDTAFVIAFSLLCILWGIHSSQRRFNLAQIAVSVFDMALLYGLMLIIVR